MEKKRKIPGIALSVICIVLAYAIMTTVIGIATMPIRYDIRAGMVSPVTITASKDVVDTITSDSLRDSAARQVEPSYMLDSTVASAVMAELDKLTPALVALGVPEGESAPKEFDQEMLDAAAAAIAPATMTRSRLELVMSTDQETLSDLATQARQRLRAQLNLNIAEGQENESIYSIQRELVSDGWDSQLAGCAADILRPVVKANMIVDTATTEANREAARAAVEDVVYIKGQNIVRSGEIVTRAQIEMLNSLGLLQEQGVDMSLISGAGIMVAMLLGMLVIYLTTFEKQMLNAPGQVLLLMTILTLTVLLCWAVMQLNVYLMPTIMGVMLTCYLMKPRLALMTCCVMAVFAGLIASGASGIFTAAVFTTMLNTLVAGALCIAVITRSKGRTSVLLAGLLCGVANMITTMAIGLTNNSNILSVLLTACWAGGAGVLSGVLCIGIQPVLEAAFNLTTNAKLFDLSNPNQPLLRRLMVEAPGTYHHSIMVANLAEAAANAIGGNGLLARVGGYYHDIGKLKRPLYFRENQLGDNPHDRTDPRVSAAIILSHPADGDAFAAKQRIPDPVRGIISRHHGRSNVVFFYDKAIKQSGIDNVDPADFTYDTGLPQTKEEAIVMLADPVEAAARALPSRDQVSIANLIDKLIDQRIRDGELNECRLTFADIAKIKEAFVMVMTGMYHERIAYPDPPPKHKHSIFGKKAQEAAQQSPAARTVPVRLEAAAEKPGAVKPVGEPKGAAEAGKPVEQAKVSAEAGKPTEQVKAAAEAVKPAVEAKVSAEAGKPAVEPKGAAEAGKPVVEPKVSAEAGKPVEQPKPAEEAKPE